MAKKSVGDLTEADLEGKRVFVRADLNVPLDENQNITDDTRIRAAVPTIQYLLSKGAKVILSSHLVSSRPSSLPVSHLIWGSNALRTHRQCRNCCKGKRQPF